MSKFKVGDRVNWTRVRGEYDGSIIEAIGYSGVWPVTIKATNGNFTYVAFSELELAPRFAVGDKVRVVNNDSGRISYVGRTGVIASDDFGYGDGTSFSVKLDGDGCELIFSDTELLPTYTSCAAAEVDNLAAEYGAPKPWTEAKPKFKVGDRVRRINHDNNPIARVGTEWVVEDVTIRLLESWLVFEGGQSGSAKNYEHVAVAPATATATLTIEAGKFYKTRDGRKVGPMARGMARGDGGHPWCGEIDDGGWPTYTDAGHWWSDYSEDSLDLIAEWPTAPTTIADIVAKHSQTGTAIVCLLENGTPKPSTVPFVHTNSTAAETEATRLANVHKGKEFGVYTLGTVAKVEKTYDHEWQRLAAGGQTIAAIKELRRLTGMGLKPSKDAVEYFRAAA